MKAPRASLRPLMRPCGMATPCPSPVEPRRSRANRLSNTTLRAMACWFSNNSPTCSNSRFLLDTCRASTASAGERSLATRVMKRGASYPLVVALVLVAQDLAVELVGEQIDRGVQVRVLAFAVQVLAAHVERHLGLLPQLVDGEDDVGVDQMVEMPRHPLELRMHVGADRRSHIQVMSAHVEVHRVSLKCLALVHGRNLKRLAIFRNSPPGDHDSLLAEDLRDARI